MVVIQGKALICLQSTKDATKFYEGKVEELGNNLNALEKILQEKNDGLRMIEDGKCHDCPDLECGFNLFFLLQFYDRKLSTRMPVLHHDTISKKGKARSTTASKRQWNTKQRTWKQAVGPTK